MATETQEANAPLAGDAEIIQEMLDNYELAYEFERENREAAEKDLAILAGNTWSEADRQQREADGRPCMQFPLLNQYTDQVIGDWRQNRAEIIARPGEGQMAPREFVTEQGQKVEAHEAYAGLIRATVRDGGAKEARDMAFEQAVSSGFGHYRIVTEYSKTGFDQVIKYHRITDQFSVYWDPSDYSYSRENAWWCQIVVTMPRKSFERDFPGAMSAADLPVPTHLQDWFAGDTVRVGEYFRKVPVSRTIVLLSDGRVVDADQLEPIADELKTQGITVVKDRTIQDHKVEWYKATGLEILERQTDYPGRYIPIVSVWGKEQNSGGGRIRYRSLIRYAHDAQRMVDYMRTAGIERIALEPKVPFIIGASQLGDYQGLWKTANYMTHAFLPYDDSVNPNPPQRQFPQQAATGMLQEANQAREDIKGAVGMYDAGVGNRSNETSGKAIMARQRESDVMSFPFIDNMGRSLNYEAKVVSDLIPKILDTRRAARMLNADESEVSLIVNQEIRDEQTGQMVKLNDLSICNFEVSVDIGPSYTTLRQEVSDQMERFITAVPAAGALTGDLIAQMQDWPLAKQFSERLKYLLPPEIRAAEDAKTSGEEPLPAHVEQQMQQMDMMIQQLQAQLQQAMPELEKAQVELTKAKMDADRAKVEQAMNKQADELKREKAALDYDKRVMALEKSVDDMRTGVEQQAGQEVGQMLQAHQDIMTRTEQAMAAFQSIGQQIAQGMAQNGQAIREAVAATSASAERIAQSADMITAFIKADRVATFDEQGNPVGMQVVGFGEIRIQ